jgi:hypothetical protein
MCVRWLATVRSPRKSAAATYTPQLRLAALDPCHGAELLESGERLEDGFARRTLLSRTPASDAEGEKGTGSSVRIVELSMPCRRALEQHDRLVDVPTGGRDLAAAAENVGKNPVPCSSQGVGLPLAQDVERLVDPT